MMWLLELAAAFFALGGFASTAAQYRIDENFRDDDGLNSLQLIALWAEDAEFDEIPTEIREEGNAYSPKRETIFLTPAVAVGTHGEALAVAAHKVGNAIQAKCGGPFWSHVLGKMSNGWIVAVPLYFIHKPLGIALLAIAALSAMIHETGASYRAFEGLQHYAPYAVKQGVQVLVLGGIRFRVSIGGSCLMAPKTKAPGNRRRVKDLRRSFSFGVQFVMRCMPLIPVAARNASPAPRR